MIYEGCTSLERHVWLYSQVELPLGATEDRICGTIDIEKALGEGIKAYEPGLLVRCDLRPALNPNALPSPDGAESALCDDDFPSTHFIRSEAWFSLRAAERWFGSGKSAQLMHPKSG